MTKLTDEDRKFLEMVDAYLLKHDYRGMTGEPKNGFQLKVMLKRVPLQRKT